jgi:hypothetical protein
MGDGREREQLVVANVVIPTTALVTLARALLAPGELVNIPADMPAMAIK